MNTVVVVATDATGLALLRRHHRLRVLWTAPSGTGVPPAVPCTSNGHREYVRPVAVTMAEAAELVGISERQVRKLVSTNELPVLRVGRSVRVRVVDVERWAEALATDVPGASGGAPAPASVPGAPSALSGDA